MSYEHEQFLTTVAQKARTSLAAAEGAARATLQTPAEWLCRPFVDGGHPDSDRGHHDFSSCCLASQVRREGVRQRNPFRHGGCERGRGKYLQTPRRRPSADPPSSRTLRTFFGRPTRDAVGRNVGHLVEASRRKRVHGGPPRRDRPRGNAGCRWLTASRPHAVTTGRVGCGADDLSASVASIRGTGLCGPARCALSRSARRYVPSWGVWRASAAGISRGMAQFITDDATGRIDPLEDAPEAVAQRLRLEVRDAVGSLRARLPEAFPRWQQRRRDACDYTTDRR
jgi:hypothetical protein